MISLCSVCEGSPGVAELGDLRAAEPHYELDLDPEAAETYHIAEQFVESRRPIWNAAEFLRQKGVSLQQLQLKENAELEYNDEGKKEKVLIGRPGQRFLVTRTLVGLRRSQSLVPHHLNQGQARRAADFELPRVSAKWINKNERPALLFGTRVG